MDGFKTNFDVFKQLRSSGNSNLSDYASLTSSVVKKFKLNLNEIQYKQLSECLRKFALNVSTKWRKSARNMASFEKRNDFWLKHTFIWAKFISQIQSKVGELQRKPFQTLSLRQKKRRTMLLRKKIWRNCHLLFHQR